jgi:uncharacterized linocin/CFP29 family protein
MDILKRNIAPLTDQAWQMIDDQAKKILTGNLSARNAFDFDGPHGLEMASVNLGRVSFAESGVIEGVLFGSRKVQPLIEVRVPFTLNLDEMDAVSRGLKAPELEALEIAARKAAHFEEKAVYRGFSEGAIPGVIPSSCHTPLPMKKDPVSYPDLVEDGIMALKKAGIAGPCLLILGNMPFQLLMQGDEKGYPLKKRIEGQLGGGIMWSPALKGGVLLSSRGGDFVLTVGQDFSIGYLSHDAQNINLYITESFTFQVLEPRAALELRSGE